MNLTGIDQKETNVSNAEATKALESFEPSALMHALTLKWLDDPENYSAAEHLAAYDVAKSEHRTVYEAADPTAAKGRAGPHPAPVRGGC